MLESKRRKCQKYYDMPLFQEIRKKVCDAYSNKLQFIEESHQYFLDGVEYNCVSNVTHMFRSFDREATLDRCARKAQTNPDYKYYGMTREEISDLWNAHSAKACEDGTITHEFGESMFYYMAGEDVKILPSAKNKFKDGKPAPTTPKERQVVKFWEELQDYMVPILAETKVFNNNGTPYAGTFDILFYYYNEEDLEHQGLVIYDYKTNEELTSPYDSYMLYPFNDLKDESLSAYILQLSLYQIPLEHLGFKVIARRIVWLTEDAYHIVKIPSEVKRLKEALNFTEEEKVLNE